jgi:hypothetical protein
MANANIFALSGCTGGAFSLRIVNPGDVSYDTICADRSTRPVGVGGDADDAGDVEVELHGEGVSGVAGWAPYEAEGSPVPGGGGGRDGFGGDGWRWPKDGIGLVLEPGGGRWEDAVTDAGAFFETICRE